MTVANSKVRFMPKDDDEKILHRIDSNAHFGTQKDEIINAFKQPEPVKIGQKKVRYFDFQSKKTAFFDEKCSSARNIKSHMEKRRPPLVS